MSEVILAGGIGGGSGGIFGGGSSGGVDTGIPGTGSTAGIGKELLTFNADNRNDPFQIWMCYNGNYRYEGYYDYERSSKYVRLYYYNSSSNSTYRFIRIIDPSKFQVYGSNAIQFTVDNTESNESSKVLGSYLVIRFHLYNNSIKGNVLFSNEASYYRGFIIPCGINNPVTYTLKMTGNLQLENWPIGSNLNSNGNTVDKFTSFGKWIDDNSKVTYIDLISINTSSDNSTYVNFKSIKFLKI